MHGFRKAQYGAAVSVIALTGIGFASRIGNHPVRDAVSVSLVSAAMGALTGLIAWVEHAATGD